MLTRFFTKRLFSSMVGRGMPGGRSTTSLKQNRVPEKVDVLGKENRARREAREMAEFQRVHAAFSRGEALPVEKDATYGPRDWRFVGKGMAILFTAAGLIYLTFSPDDVNEDLQRIGGSAQARDAMSYVLTNSQAGFPSGRTHANYTSTSNSPFAKLHAIEDAPPAQPFFANNGGVYPNAAAAGSVRKSKNAAAAAAAAAEAAVGEPVAAGTEVA